MNNELTRKDIEDMEAEIEHRKVVVRKELLEHVKEARAQGDLSENFEYYAAKKAKNQNEETYKIVTTMRQNSLKGLISVESPLGKQLLGHRVGDRVNIKVSDNYSYEITITKIENTGLTEDDKIRDF